MHIRKMTFATMAALLVVTLPLAALAGHGHGKTRVYIGGSFWLGPPAWGPAYYGPGYYYPPPPYYAPAPVIVQQIGRTIARLKSEGFTILLVEQNFRFAATVADRHYVMENGRVVDMIPNAQLEANMHKLHEYLGV